MVCMASRDEVDVDAFHKSIQYTLEKLGKPKFGFERTDVSNVKRKKDEGSGNEVVDYSRAPCLGADQKARGLWERDCNFCFCCAFIFWQLMKKFEFFGGSRAIRQRHFTTSSTGDENALYVFFARVIFVEEKIAFRLHNLQKKCKEFVHNLWEKCLCQR